MKVAVLSAVWKRPEITKLFVQHLVNMKLPKGMKLSITLVGSPGDAFPVSLGKYVHYLQAPNAPLSNKWNAGLAVMNKDFDYLLILGSDDFPNSAYFEFLQEKAAMHEAFGLTDLYVANAPSKEVHYWPGYITYRSGETIGAGRVLSKEVVKAMGYQLWDEGKAKGLDGSMSNKLATKGVFIKGYQMLNTPVRLFDLKSNQNLGAWSSYAGISIQSAKFFRKHYSDYLFQKFMQL